VLLRVADIDRAIDFHVATQPDRKPDVRGVPGQGAVQRRHERPEPADQAHVAGAELLAGRAPTCEAIAGRLLGRVVEHDGHDEARVDDDAHRRGSRSARA
jgi:hypothetical protein